MCAFNRTTHFSRCFAAWRGGPASCPGLAARDPKLPKAILGVARQAGKANDTRGEVLSGKAARERELPNNPLPGLITEEPSHDWREHNARKAICQFFAGDSDPHLSLGSRLETHARYSNSITRTRVPCPFSSSTMISLRREGGDESQWTLDESAGVRMRTTARGVVLGRVTG